MRGSIHKLHRFVAGLGLVLILGLSLSCMESNVSEAKKQSTQGNSMLPSGTDVDFSDISMKDQGSDAPAGTKDIFTVLYTIIEGGGTLMLIYGTIKYGIGMTSDEPREYAKGVSYIICGAILANISLAVNM